MAINWNESTVLVTGGAGFIGSHLCEALRALGAKVVVVDNFVSGSRDNLSVVAQSVEVVELDVGAPALHDFVRDRNFDVIFHLAGNAYVPPSVEDPAFDYENNLSATFRLLDTLRKSNSRTLLIYTSSAAVYGNPVSNPIRENSPLAPISPYGVSKLAAERYVEVFSNIYGLRAASARLFSTYGPRQRKQVIYDFISKLYKNSNELVIYGNGSQRRDFNFVTDTANALIRIAEHGRHMGEVYNVASGHHITIAELARFIACCLQLHPLISYTMDVRPGDPDQWIADIRKLQGLGYAPQVSLEDGLSATVGWFREQLGIFGTS